VTAGPHTAKRSPGRVPAVGGYASSSGRPLGTTWSGPGGVRAGAGTSTTPRMCVTNPTSTPGSRVPHTGRVSCPASRRLWLRRTPCSGSSLDASRETDLDRDVSAMHRRLTVNVEEEHLRAGSHQAVRQDWPERRSQAACAICTYHAREVNPRGRAQRQSGDLRLASIHACTSVSSHSRTRACRTLGSGKLGRRESWSARVRDTPSIAARSWIPTSAMALNVELALKIVSLKTATHGFGVRSGLVASMDRASLWSGREYARRGRSAALDRMVICAASWSGEE